jgi:hypothetical protein
VLTRCDDSAQEKHYKVLTATRITARNFNSELESYNRGAQFISKPGCRQPHNGEIMVYGMYKEEIDADKSTKDRSKSPDAC